ncbi:complement C1q-like protein 2 [Fundulus diaphanus]
MKKVAVLMLVFGLCHSFPETETNDKVCVCAGSNSCCNICSLTSVTQKMGELGEKAANLAEKVTFLETRLQNAEKEILELRSLTGGTPQVAFSAALRESGSGNTGPFTTAIPLQYKKVFSNTGNSYNPSTGIFTAMVSGMYFFRFSMFNNLAPTPSSVVSLMKNNERLTSVWDTSGTDSNDMGSNAVVIALTVGDNVYVQLEPNRVVYDDVMNYNTFSGFLLFPV